MSPSPSRLALLRGRSLLGLSLLLLPAFAGCGGTFEEAKPEWAPGYRWQYDVRESELEAVEGKIPESLQEDFDEAGQARYANSTARLEILNTTATSVEGFPIYVGVEFTEIEGSPAPSRTGGRDDPILAPAAPGAWEARVFNAGTLNPVVPVRASWRDGAVQLSGDEEAGATQIASEQRWYDWPLRPGKTWRETSSFDGPPDEEGAVDHKVLRKESRKVPAGSFETIRIRSTATPPSTAILERQIQASLEAEGFDVKSIGVSFVRSRIHWYSPQVRNLVEASEQFIASISVAGKAPNGEGFDFSLVHRESAQQVLLKYELTLGAAKPLTFVNEVLSGAYAARPITPTAHFAVEILARRSEANAGTGEEATLFARVFNSTAGEKLRRDPDNPAPAESPSGTPYDHERFLLEWTVERDGPSGWKTVGSFVADELRFTPTQWEGVGLKRITLVLKDKSSGEKVSDDQVLFEVYWSRRLSVVAGADNVTDEGVRFDFPLAYGARAVEGRVTWSDETPRPAGRLRVYDQQGTQVSDDNETRYGFSTRKPQAYVPGTWEAVFHETLPPPVVGTTYTVEVTVRYRSL